MAKFTKSTDAKKGAKNGSAVDKAISKVAGGIVKKNKTAQKPAVAPAAAAKRSAVVKAAIVAEAKPKKAAAAAQPAKQPQQEKAQKQQQPKEKKERQPIKPGVSVFVGNLPPTIKRKTLQSLFKDAGTVSSIRFRRSNGSKLFKRDLAHAKSIIAFVDLATPNEARAAAKALNGHKIGDNVLRCDVKAGGKNAPQTDAKRTAFVGNLAYSTTDNAVRKAFESCGPIEYVRLNQSKKGCDGTAFVCFKEAAAVAEALKLNGTEINKRPVRVHRSEKKQKEAAAKRNDEEAKKPQQQQQPEEEEEEEDDDEDDDEEDFSEDDDSEDGASIDDDDESEDELPAPVAAKKSKPAAPKAAAAGAKNKKGGNKKA